MTSKTFLDEINLTPTLEQLAVEELENGEVEAFLRARRHQKPVSGEKAIEQTLHTKLGLGQIIGKSPAFIAEMKKIPAIAQSDVNVLIAGETGTGKEISARAIHYVSPRAGYPFIPVNCGAIPSELVENELFGHQRGAFTDAATSQHGVIREAEGGTLFLDEIDSLPLPAQVKLLRFLQDRHYRPLGSPKTHYANVRVIAATNTDVEEAVTGGKLRKDLYYRLRTIPFRLPPLRERREDIPLLAQYFLQKYAAEFNKPLRGFSSEAVQQLTRYHWPGNVRELEHLIQGIVALSTQMWVRSEDLNLPQRECGTLPEPFQQAKARVVEAFEKTYIQELLLAYQGNITRAARAARKNRRAFWELMRKHQIDARLFLR